MACDGYPEDIAMTAMSVEETRTVGRQASVDVKPKIPTNGDTINSIRPQATCVDSISERRLTSFAKTVRGWGAAALGFYTKSDFTAQLILRGRREGEEVKNYGSGNLLWV